MLERDFQRELKAELLDKFPGCFIFKTDPSHQRGVPDLIILYEDKWAALEVKRSKNAPRQRLQEKRLSLLDGMSFAALICPENKEEVLDDLEYTFKACRKAR